MRGTVKSAQRMTGVFFRRGFFGELFAFFFG